MSPLRQFRVFFAALAIIFSPGGITPWLQLAHACGPDTQVESAGMEHSAEHAGHDASAPSGPNHHLQHCICVGACATVSFATTTGHATIAIAAVSFRSEVVAPVASRPVAVPQHSHPFAQAPPLA